jgi:hypothetical protein
MGMLHAVYAAVKAIACGRKSGENYLSQGK